MLCQRYWRMKETMPHVSSSVLCVCQSSWLVTGFPPRVNVTGWPRNKQTLPEVDTPLTQYLPLARQLTSLAKCFPRTCRALCACLNSDLLPILASNTLLNNGSFSLRSLCFVVINSVLFNLLCVWILFYNASRHSSFRFLVCVVFSPEQISEGNCISNTQMLAVKGLKSLLQSKTIPKSDHQEYTNVGSERVKISSAV